MKEDKDKPRGYLASGKGMQVVGIQHRREVGKTNTDFP